MKFQKTVLALMLAATNLAATAADYFVVVPVLGRVSPVVVTLNATPLPAGVVGLAYSYDFKSALQVTGDATYNASNVTWTLDSGALPAGLSLSAQGVVSGTPTAVNAGSTFSLKAAYKSKAGQQTYQIVTVQMAVLLASATIPAGVVGLAYPGFNFSTLASVPSDPSFTAGQVTYTLTGGTLPTGMTLSSAGVLSGTPQTAATSAPFQVTATYKSATGAHSYTITTANLTIALAAATLPTATVGGSYNNTGFDFASQLSVTGDPSYTASQAAFTLTSGTLPAGMTLSSTGKLTGIPTEASAGSNLDITATYKFNSAVRTYSWTANTAAPDPYYANVALLLHMDGTSGGTTFTDEKGHTFTRGSTPTTDRTQVREGTASARFSADGQFITSPASASWNPGSTYTLEFSVYPVGVLAASTFSRFISMGPNSFDSSHFVQLDSGNTMVVGIPLSGRASISAVNAFVGNAWNDMAVVVTNGSASIYRNGTRIAGPTTVSTPTVIATNQLWIGSNGASGASTYGKSFPGYMDKVRYTPGVARYSGSTYSVPDVFPNY